MVAPTEVTLRCAIRRLRAEQKNYSLVPLQVAVAQIVPAPLGIRPGESASWKVALRSRVAGR